MLRVCKGVNIRRLENDLEYVRGYYQVRVEGGGEHATLKHLHTDTHIMGHSQCNNQINGDISFPKCGRSSTANTNIQVHTINITLKIKRNILFVPCFYFRGSISLRMRPLGLIF